MPDQPHIVIIGSGPTGLGAAWRLVESDHQHWTLFEASDHAGGLASSVVDERGFTWDLGGHVLFSHYRYFDNLLDSALQDRWYEHQREAWVWYYDRWVPYPFQNNLWRLPKETLIACIDGLIAAHEAADTDPVRNFEDWLRRSFGDGLCHSFMFPYNEKVWAYPPRMLDVGWMRERVATVDLRRIVKNMILQEDDVGWGPNATFRFPERGGTGAIWQSVCSQLPAERVHFGHSVVSIDASARTVTLANGRSERYDYLISTMPLDVLIHTLVDPGPLMAYAGEFVHSSSHIVGIGLDGTTPEDLQTKCWMYFPDPAVPFYRATVFSNYSANNVPRPGKQWSLMAEISESPGKRVDTGSVIEETIQGFRHCRLISPTQQILSTWHRRIEHGYPTPWLGRDDVLGAVEAELTKLGIFSRGRFGAWKYEVSNQDHSVMQGVEAVERILNGGQEFTYHGDMKDHLWEPLAEAY